MKNGRRVEGSKGRRVRIRIRIPIRNSSTFDLRLLTVLFLAACADDPIYLEPLAPVEINLPDMSTNLSLSSLTIPFRQETLDETAARESLARDLGLDPSQVPTVRRDHLDIAIEWTIKNLDDTPAVALVSVNGANEFFAYDPTLFVIDPDEDEQPPPLLGGRPIEVPALGTVSGVFREDELEEAAMDLDAITRAGLTPESALLNQWDGSDITGANVTMEIPGAAVPSLLRLDVSFQGDNHMVLEYVVRVRDHVGRLVPDEPDTPVVAPAAAAYDPTATAP
jgi:hypothetical protein